MSQVQSILHTMKMKNAAAQASHSQSSGGLRTTQ